jgi:hypothetical protein
MKSDLIDKLYEDVYTEINKLTPEPCKDYSSARSEHLDLIVGVTAISKEKFIVRVQNTNDFSDPKYVTGTKDEIMLNLKKVITEKSEKE